jgi:hypothetical protein
MLLVQQAEYFEEKLADGFIGSRVGAQGRLTGVCKYGLNNQVGLLVNSSRNYLCV